MSLDDLLKRRALRLKTELSEGDRPKPSFLSTIYPAMDHGDVMPHTVKTPSSIPSSNDEKGEEAASDGPEKGEKEVDEPGPSKTTSSSNRLPDGTSSMVPDAHKKAAFELGYFGEHRSEQFIKKCVELITGVKRLEQDDPTEGGDVDVHSSKGHGKGSDSECSCGGTCDDCKKAAGNGSSGGRHDHSKLSDLAKKFDKPKSSYG